MKVVRHTVRNMVLVFAGINILYSIAGFVCVPAYIRKKAILELSKMGRNEVFIHKLRFNPYSCKVVIEKFQVHNKSSGFLFFVENFSLDFSPVMSLFSGMPVFSGLLLRDGQMTYVKSSLRSHLMEYLLAFDWSVVPQFRVARALVVNSGFYYENTTLPKEFYLRIRTLDIGMDNFVMHGKRNRMSLEAKTDVGEKAVMDAFFDLEPYGASGNVLFDGIRLAKYEAYMGALADYSISDGSLSGRTSFDFDSSVSERKAVLRDLSLVVESLSVKKNEEIKERFGFGALSVDGAMVDFLEKEAQFNSALMTDGMLVLDSFLPGALTGTGPYSGVATWESAAIAKSFWCPDRSVSFIGSLSVRDGTILLSDDSLSPPAHLAVRGIDVSTGDVYCDTSRTSEFSVSANIGDSASVQMFGETNPFDVSAHTRFRLLARNVDLVPFGQYAEKYFGYGLDGGSFGLDTSLYLHDRKLNVRNKVVVDRLELGKKSAVKTRNAASSTEFPVPFAVTFLKDERGGIEIDVPITGTLAHPRTDLRKALTDGVFRPFGFAYRWLTGMDEKPVYQDFDAGSSDIAGQDTEKLDALIKRLEETPLAVIDIQGSVDVRRDERNLYTLAKDRAASVSEYIVAKGGIGEERVFVLNSPYGMVCVEGSRVFMSLNYPLGE